MRLVAGVLASAPQASGVRDALLVQFTLSPDRLDETALVDSAFAPPGRYLGEMLRRLAAFVPRARVILAFNPYLELGPDVVDALLAEATAWEPGGEAFRILADARGRPLAYALARDVIDLCGAVHPSLLSCTDADLDGRFLHASLGAGTVVKLGRLRGGAGVGEPANGFWVLSPALPEATRRAIDLLAATPAAARADLVRNGPRTAVIGYHAGDVLFWTQALALERTPFRSVAVLAPFADIVAYLAPELESLIVRQPIPHRSGYHVTDDHAVLLGYVGQLEREGTPPHFWHLFRPFRDYSRTQHHLREQMAFALGGAGHGPRAPRAARERPAAAPHTGRVIVHFEAGWSLKELPAGQRGELLALLAEAGWEPVILGKPEPAAPGVPAVPYTNLRDFLALLDSADAILGSDSFPSHFAQVVGVPTVQLFGCTRPANSRGTASASYQWLHHPLPCVPCNQQTICLLDGGSGCRAQATAPEISAALRDVLTQERQPLQRASERGPRKPPKSLAERALRPEAEKT